MLAAIEELEAMMEQPPKGKSAGSTKPARGP
jgi:hypothetical protein